MNRIGYTGGPAKNISLPGQVDDRHCLLRFDSGYGITYADGAHHVLITGSTGSGKTASVILPAILRLLKGGHSGLIIDIKGNMRARVRKLAQECGREQDLVELGSGPEALRLNILEGLTRFEMYDFFEDLLLQSFDSKTHNLDFHIKGVGIAVDCGELLCYLREHDPRFVPCVSTIYDMLCDYPSAATLFRLFREKVMDESNEEHARFVARINSNRFHVLKERKDASRGGASSTTEEQMTYNLHGIRNALKNFMDAPGIVGHFSSPGAPGLDLRPLLEKGKVLLLRFDLDTGPIGARLARALLNYFYASVYALGLNRAPEQYYFVCVDEFQEVADLSSKRYSDVNFIAQAREFGCIFLASTQSMAALVNRGASVPAVEAFVSNCNQRIMFYSDDPLTQEMARRYDENMLLNRLEAGHAFVVRYDQRQMRHLFGTDTLNNEFGVANGIIQDAPQSGPELSSDPNAESNVVSLYGLVAAAREMLATSKAGARCSLGNAGHSKSPGAAAAMPHMAEDGRAAQRKRLSRKYEHAENTENFSHEAADEPATLREEGMRPKKHRLIIKYPDLFADGDDVQILIPRGWEQQVDKVLGAFATLGLPMQITSIRLRDGYLRATDEVGSRYSSSGSEAVLNALLWDTRNLCMRCGAALERPKPDKHGDDEDDFDERPNGRTHPLCNACRAAYGLLPPGGVAN